MLECAIFLGYVNKKMEMGANREGCGKKFPAKEKMEENNPTKERESVCVQGQGRSVRIMKFVKGHGNLDWNEATTQKDCRRRKGEKRLPGGER